MWNFFLSCVFSLYYQIFDENISWSSDSQFLDIFSHNMYYVCIYIYTMWVVYVIFIIHNFAVCITQQAPTRVQIIGVASVYSDCVPLVIHFSPAGCSSPPTLYSALLLCTSMRAPFTIVGVDMKFRGQRLDRAEEAHPAKKKTKKQKKRGTRATQTAGGREEGTNDGKRKGREGEDGTSFRIYRRSCSRIVPLAGTRQLDIRCYSRH